MESKLGIIVVKQNFANHGDKYFLIKINRQKFNFNNILLFLKNYKNRMKQHSFFNDKIIFELNDSHFNSGDWNMIYLIKHIIDKEMKLNILNFEEYLQLSMFLIDSYSNERRRILCEQVALLGLDFLKNWVEENKDKIGKKTFDFFFENIDHEMNNYIIQQLLE